MRTLRLLLRVTTTVVLAALLAGVVQAQVPELLLQGAGRVPGGGIQAQVTPVETDGSVAAGLTPKNFAVTLLGKKGVVRQVAAQSDAQGMGVILMLDVSGSMRGAKIAAARQAAIGFVRRLGARDRAALITFGETALLTQDFTGDKRALIAALQKVQVTNQNTNLYDALEVADRITWGAAPGHRSIVLLTDGVDTASSLRADDIVRLVQRRGVPVQAIAVGPQPDVSLLKRLALMSDGRFWQADNPAVLGSLYARVWSRVDSAYAVTFAPPASVPASAPFLLTWLRADGRKLTVRGRATGAAPAVVTARPAQPTPTLPSVGGAGVRPPSPIAPAWDHSRIIALVVAALVLLAVLGAALAMRRRPPPPVMDDDDPPTQEFRPVEPVTYSTPAPIRVGRDEEFSDAPSRAPVDRPTLVRRPAEAEPVAWLFAESGPVQGRQFLITDKEVIIGRGADAQVRLTDDDEVSRRHAKLTQQDDGQFQIVDMASANGVLLNGEKVHQATVRDGDRLEVGTSRLIFKSVGDGALSPASRRNHTTEENTP